MDESEIGMIRIKWDVNRHHLLLSNHEQLIGIVFNSRLTVVNTARQALSYLKVLKPCYNNLVAQHPYLQPSFCNHLCCGTQPLVIHTVGAGLMMCHPHLFKEQLVRMARSATSSTLFEFSFFITCCRQLLEMP